MTSDTPRQLSPLQPHWSRRVGATLARVGLTPALARYAVVVWAASRVGYILLTVLTIRFLRPTSSGSVPFIDAWARYDATYYARLARDGYQASLLYRAAFFPLQPLVTHLVSPLTGGNTYVAGLVVSNTSDLFALLGLAALAQWDADTPSARRAVLYLTLFPMAFFLFAGYAESLYLALAIWCVVATRHGWWWQAGVLGLLAALTRQAGIFLVFPFAFEYATSAHWRLDAIRLNVLWGALIPCGLLIFAGWLWLAVGDPLAFAHAESSWHHTLTPPWETLWRALLVLPHQPDRIYLLRALVDLVSVLLFAVLIVLLGIARQQAGDVIYCAAFWLLALSYPTVGWPLQSDARYMLTIFPCFVLLAAYGRRRWLHIAIVTVFSVLLVIMTQYFLRGAVIL